MKETTELYYDIKCPACQYMAAKGVDTEWVDAHPDLLCMQCGFRFAASAALEVVDLDVVEPTAVEIPEPPDIVPEREYFMKFACPTCGGSGSPSNVKFDEGFLVSKKYCDNTSSEFEIIRPGYHRNAVGRIVKDETSCPPCPKCGEKVTVWDGSALTYTCTNPECREEFVPEEFEPSVDEPEDLPKAEGQYEAYLEALSAKQPKLCNVRIKGKLHTSIADSVYQGIEDRCGVSYIRLAEDIIERDDVPVKVRMLIAMGLKYLIRVGDKGDWEKDLKKGLNYITRAATGKWAKNADE